MPRSHHGAAIRIERGQKLLGGTLYVDPEFITNRFLAAMITVAEGATQVMEDRVNTADTRTGLAEGRRGRVKTGAMIGSLRGAGSRPVTVEARSASSGRAVIRFGWGPDAPDYTRFQDLGTRTIEAMHAKQLGFNYFASHVLDEMAGAAEDVGNYVLGERLLARSYRFGGGQ